MRRLFKTAWKDIMKEMQSLISDIWRNEQIPNNWKTGIICPIFKKGDIGIESNYRGISLLDLAYTVLPMALLRRLEVYAEEILAEYQTGFKRVKSTTDHIFTLGQLMEKYYEYNRDLYILFVDFKQAYDSIDREQLWIALRNFRIPKKIVKLVEICNQQIFYKVRFMGETSENFEYKTGLRQGDALSPVLFNLALKIVIRDIREEQEMKIIVANTLLAYADDIVILGIS
jgi:sorting nexin-29